MKKQNWLQIGLMLTLFAAKESSAQQQASTMSNVDPIVDLRAPRSLFEVLHNGINDIYVSLQSGLDAHADLSSIALSARDDLNALSDQYDSMINTTRSNQVYRDDKEFLQKMIDRISSMIDDLENKESEEIDDDTQDLLRSVKEGCDSFKEKVSS